MQIILKFKIINAKQCFINIIGNCVEIDALFKNDSRCPF